MSTRRQLGYFQNLGIALTRTLAALIGADYRTSFSSQAYSWEKRRKIRGYLLRPLIDLLFFFEPDHCKSSYTQQIKVNKYDAS